MSKTKAYAALSATSALQPFEIERRNPDAFDVQIETLFCGVCHSDIHQARDEWGGSTFPMVPGHEIVGRVTRVGPKVTKFKEGDLAGVGCLVDSCRTCSSCKHHEEQYCEGGFVGTYNGTEKDGKTRTFGGYSGQIVVDENFTLKIPKHLALERVAPLLCAGITTYSPLKHWKVSKGHRVGVVGLGGLGHMAVKIASALGAEVTVLSTSASKKNDALKLGASEFVQTSDAKQLEARANHFDFIVNTVSAPMDLTPYLEALATNGSMVLLGAPPKPAEVSAFSLIFKRRSLAGSLIGGIKETQEMLDFCAAKEVLADVETIRAEQINTAYERMLKGDVKYRFVIDLKTL